MQKDLQDHFVKQLVQELKDIEEARKEELEMEQIMPLSGLMESQSAHRGDEILKISESGNFLFIFGCQPGEGLKEDTLFLQDLTLHLEAANDVILLPDYLINIK